MSREREGIMRHHAITTCWEGKDNYARRSEHNSHGRSYSQSPSRLPIVHIRIEFRLIRPKFTFFNFLFFFFVGVSFSRKIERRRKNSYRVHLSTRQMIIHQQGTWIVTKELLNTQPQSFFFLSLSAQSNWYHCKEYS